MEHAFRYRLTELRKKAGLTQSELAKRSKVSRATIAAMETKPAKTTTSRVLLNLSDALNCTVDDLFTRELSNR